MFLEKFQAGEAVVAVMLGNSIGMGYNATGHEQLSSRYNESRGFAVEHRDSGYVGHSRMLRDYLKSRNPSSELINLSGDGWDTNDHLGISLPSSSAPPHQSSDIVIRSLSPKPDIVFIPLQVNDPNHQLSVQTFANNTRRIVSSIKEAGIEAVIVRENATEIPGYPRFVACASELAREMRVGVIDTYTPTLGRADLMSDYAHPNEAGHRVIFEQYRAWLSAPRADEAAAASPDPTACLD
ncbi:SGNH/GDSL hydrolase family protein [Pseudomonas sp. F(2018)]|uniref:SGNH/GDSL hydrolase family protein n=1 Tax=Pseudomonas sp. F(2018) TaxID=2502240 RepID=UPI0010F479C9|nr:SGNH/GDSL hydrolase family protein [Pseudomonas sp. F(2018)]